MDKNVHIEKGMQSSDSCISQMICRGEALQPTSH